MRSSNRTTDLDRLIFDQGSTVHYSMIMQTADIDREIRTFIVQHFLSGRSERLRDNSSLLGDVIDSSGVIELISHLQEHFGIMIDDDEVVPDNLDSVNNLVSFVTKKIQNRSKH